MDKPKLGATGNFPQGKLHQSDEGELQLAFMVKDGKVIVNFGKPVAWLGLAPADARQFAVFLMKRANEADKSEPFIRAGGDVVCEVCGDVYRRHAHDMKELDNMGEPFLRVRCDGRRLKL
jgi:hypothetical protein